jgi:SAM-dependent methyltransferase
VSRSYYYTTLNEETGRELSDRLGHLRSALHLVSTYNVLDIGCAEGLISMEIAPFVSEVRAFDIRPQRMQAARKLAQEHHIPNVRFEVGSLFEVELAPLSYDVVLFLGVYHQLPKASREHILRTILEASRHQVAIRTRIHRDPEVRKALLDACRDKGFEVTFERTYEAERYKETRELKRLWGRWSGLTTTLHRSLMLVATRLGSQAFFLWISIQAVLPA